MSGVEIAAVSEVSGGLGMAILLSETDITNSTGKRGGDVQVEEVTGT